jgi:hypothetical protein
MKINLHLLGVGLYAPGMKGGEHVRRYTETIIVRCSDKLKRTVNQWAKRDGRKPGEVARRVLEVAFGVEPDDINLPSGVTKHKPDQDAPK